MENPSTSNDSRPNKEELEEKINELTRTNGILKANISTLYRTARAEIGRKNDRIAELQAELDDMIFKRLDIKYERSQKEPDGARGDA